MSFHGSALCLILLVTVAGAQSLPPARHDGFVYDRRHRDEDSVVIEAFLDPICPDSRDVWAPLMEVVGHYGNRVLLIVHLLPLPYHDNAFLASRGLHIVDEMKINHVFNMLEWFFENQEKLYNAQTLNVSRSEVVDRIVKLMTDGLGGFYGSRVESGFMNKETDHKTRVSFKYAANRGVFGTPTFFVNGFIVSDVGSAITFESWKSYIDPLVNAKGLESDEKKALLRGRV